MPRWSVIANVVSGTLGRHGGLWTALAGLPAGEIAAAYGYLDEVGLAALAAQRAGTLSEGQAPGPCRWQSSSPRT